MSRLCWICGSISGSREHKIKRSDIVRAFGDGPFKNDGGLLHFVDGQPPRELQGPNSKLLKYEPVLCGECNSNRSQPWDKAYETFVNWVYKNERITLARRYIDLNEVFGEEVAVNSCLSLYKYFVKAFGCRLASADYTVPAHLVALLSKDSFQTKLRITFDVYKAVFAMAPEHRHMLGLGGLVRMDSVSMGQMERYYFQLNIGWLVIGFHYDTENLVVVDAEWAPDSTRVDLGIIEGPTLDELIECARLEGAPALAELEALREAGGIKIE